MDLDSTVCEVHGDHKQGAAYGATTPSATTRWLPPVLTAAGCCTPAHRPGQHRPRHRRFVDELAARVRRTGASGS